MEVFKCLIVFFAIANNYVTLTAPVDEDEVREKRNICEENGIYNTRRSLNTNEITGVDEDHVTKFVDGGVWILRSPHLPIVTFITEGQKAAGEIVKGAKQITDGVWSVASGPFTIVNGGKGFIKGGIVDNVLDTISSNLLINSTPSTSTRSNQNDSNIDVENIWY